MNLEEYSKLDAEIMQIIENNELEIKIESIFKNGINNENHQILYEYKKIIEGYVDFIQKNGEDKYNQEIKNKIAYLHILTAKKRELYATYPEWKEKADNALKKIIPYEKIIDIILEKTYDIIDEGTYAEDLTIIAEVKQKSKEIKKQFENVPKEYQNCNLTIDVCDKLEGMINNRLKEEILNISILKKIIADKYTRIKDTNELLFCEEEMIRYDSCIENIMSVLNEN